MHSAHVCAQAGSISRTRLPPTPAADGVAGLLGFRGIYAHRRIRKRPRTSSTMSMSPSTTFNTVAVVVTGSRRSGEATTVDPPDNPDIMTRELDARSWAVRQLWAAADLTSAIDLGCRVAPADSQRVLGAEHPTTLDARHDLAVAYASAEAAPQCHAWTRVAATGEEAAAPSPCCHEVRPAVVVVAPTFPG